MIEAYPHLHFRTGIPSPGHHTPNDRPMSKSPTRPWFLRGMLIWTGDGFMIIHWPEKRLFGGGFPEAKPSFQWGRDERRELVIIDPDCGKPNLINPKWGWFIGIWLSHITPLVLRTIPKLLATQMTRLQSWLWRDPNQFPATTNTPSNVRT